MGGLTVAVWFLEINVSAIFWKDVPGPCTVYGVCLNIVRAVRFAVGGQGCDNVALTAKC